MSRPNCSESWLIEAVRDGRVTGGERTSFERHLEECRECTARSQRMRVCLEKLNELPSGLPDTFTLRRKRRELLRAFDGSLVATSNKRAVWRLRLMAAFAVVGLAVFGVRFARYPQAEKAHWVSVSAGADASWSEQRSNQADHITLRSGRFQLSIHRPSADSQVMITLPDGEIEDVGTELAVWIDGTRTSHVSVERGNVIVRMVGLPELRLGAGEHWDRTAEAHEDAPVVLEPTAPPVEEHPSTAPRKQAGQPRRAALPVPSRTHQDVVDKVAAAQSASEDAAYLKALRLFEAGQREQAFEATEEYLARYPRGFRRLEALSIARRLQLDAKSPEGR